MTALRPKGNSKIPLPGGQSRLREAILHVSHAFRTAEKFGQTKLNKTIWRADFRAFAERGIPVTGREYQRLDQGPCLVEMVPVQRDLAAEGIIRFEDTMVGRRREVRVVPTGNRPNIRYLSDDDLAYLDEAVAYYWDKTATETSDESHGPAWQTHVNRQRLNYETALLIDGALAPSQMERLDQMAHAGHWRTV